MNDDAKIPGYDETVRIMIRHEDANLSARVTWMATFQGFLFASLGFAWKDAKPLIAPISLVAIAIAILTIVDVIAATRAQYNLVKWWDENKPTGYAGPDIIGGRYDTKKTRQLGVVRFFSPQVYVAAFIGGVWIYIFIFHRT